MSEAEEKILDRKSLTSSRAFNRLFDQTLNNIIFDIKIDKKQKRMSETQILSLLYDKKRSTRARAAKSLTDGLNSEKRLIIRRHQIPQSLLAGFGAADRQGI